MLAIITSGSDAVVASLLSGEAFPRCRVSEHG
jgi:hypothetical protein